MARNLHIVLLLGVAFAGCAPRAAYYRPADRRALGRDGLVGTYYRVPAGARDNQAGAVVALAPLVWEPFKSNKHGYWKLGAMIEFRNKRKASIIFLPKSVKLSWKDFGEIEQWGVTRSGGSKRLSAPVEIRHWRRASFLAIWMLPAEKAAPREPLTLTWKYRYAGKTYAQKTRFTATDSKLAERSRSGVPEGLVTGSSSRSTSGVPFLMNIPFVGGLFRGSTEVRSGTVTTVGSRGSARGTWWPLEPERSR